MSESDWRKKHSKPRDDLALPVFDDCYVKSYPDHDAGECLGQSLLLSDILTLLFTSDAHFAAYTSPLSLRLNVRAPSSDLRVVMRAFIVDIDAPDKSVSHAWRLKALDACERLQGSPYGYFTRGGLRLVWRLRPYEIKSLDDAAKWSRAYVRAILSISNGAIGFVPDPICRDWTRLFRVPHGVRDGQEQMHGVACGRVDSIGFWPSTKLPESLLKRACDKLCETFEAWQPARAILFPSPKTESQEPKDYPHATAKAGAQSALRLAVDRVSAAKPGMRNATLYSQSVWLAEIVAKGEIDQVEVMGAMLNAGLICGLKSNDIARTLASAFKPKVG